VLHPAGSWRTAGRGSTELGGLLDDYSVLGLAKLIEAVQGRML
jgi:hypothetical protein